MWCGDGTALARFSAGSIEEKLPLSSITLESLGKMTRWHDTALNWNYPPDPGPWKASEYTEFDDAAGPLFQAIEEELGHGFEVVYETL